MTKTKKILNTLMIYFVIISLLSVYIFSIHLDSLNSKLYIISILVMSSIGLTFFLGKKYMILMEKEAKRVKHKSRKPIDDEVKQPASWGEVLNNANSKKI